MESRKQIGEVILDLTEYDPKDVYSDGAIEDEMLEVVRDGTTEDLTNLLNTTKSWPLFYHFSPIRENILNWYPFEPDSSVLEIGAGCGAVTGALTRKCANVTANDLSLRRSEINAWRHKDCKNLTIVVSNFQQLAAMHQQQYDYVTLIGVFEYAGSYINSPKPYEDLLNMAAGMLKTGGKLLIAIENRFGAKYFAGCAEDHLGTYFSGVAGYPRKSSVKTLNRQEWINFLDNLGYRDYRFYYPYPDYKFPKVIYSDDKLPGAGELIQNMNNMDMDRYLLFNEDQFWDSVAGTEYFRDFSNSFFLEITRKEE